MPARVAAAGTSGTAAGASAAAALAAEMLFGGNNGQHQQHRNDPEYDPIGRIHKSTFFPPQRVRLIF